MVSQRMVRLEQDLLRDGHRQGELTMLRRLLERKFGELPPEAIERLERADVDLLLKWSDRVLTATTLDGIFDV